MPHDVPFEHLHAFPGKAIPGMIKGFYAWRDHTRASRRTVAPEAPAAMVIAGADLGVDPQALFRAPPGALYVVRSAAPVVSPNMEGFQDHGLAASAEFAITILGVGDIIVLGHRGAAMVSALLGHAGRIGAMFGQGVQIPGWFTIAEEPLARALRPAVPEAERPRVLAQEMVRVSIENLMTYPWVVERVMEGALGLHGWYLDEGQRLLARLDPESDEFVAI